MWKAKMLLIFISLSCHYSALAVAQSEEVDSSEVYDYPDVINIRMFPQLFTNGKSDESSSSSLSPIQRYWQNIMQNIPTFGWNVTNPLGNLFGSGAQEMIETPVRNQQVKRRNRRRKNSKARRTAAKRRNSRRRSHSQYSYATPYGQMQLQPLGIDQHNVMHFYDARTGQYYALHVETSPYQYNQQQQQQYQYYNPQYPGYEAETYDSGDSYYGEDDYDHEHDHGHNSHHHDGHHYYEDNDEGDEGTHDDHHYDNEYDSYHEAEHAHTDDYGDDVQVVDNWGYSDDDIFGERKLKLALTPITVQTKDEGADQENRVLKSSIIKLQKNLLQPETEKDVMLLLANNPKENHRRHHHKPSAGSSGNKESVKFVTRFKPIAISKPNEEMEVETLRNVLGSYMRDDSVNRKIQRSGVKSVKRRRLVETPRAAGLYRHYARLL